MQETSSHALLDLLKSLQAPIGAVLGALAQWLFTRWKQKPEAAILVANAEKTRAEARKIDGEILDRAHDRIDELVAVNFQLRQDCLALQKKVDMAELRERMYDEGRRQTKARLVLQEAKDDESDERQSKQDSPSGE